ncbi:lysosomal alpha-mannosidase-like [Haliotis rufescens]|uniref:lysosomal alpha-mannosidase-like n=1 Tax=Haliotis rufescens TaxID=6454 RepID=UPI00201F268E|nr:lysosomal alpha-mannosidase-like [Haliotis rufescens]
MRLHLRRCLWVALPVVAVQLVIMYWGARSPSVRKSYIPLRHVQSRDLPAKQEFTGTCNPDLCNPVRDDMLNVHIVAHSHDDVGWLKTMDQYYTGEKSVGSGYSHHFGHECVRCVLNTTIPELLENPKRKFIFIEMAFLSMWWKEIDQQTQAQVKELIKQRRLEIVIGGWCMSDAATTFYNDIIDQHTLGFDFIDRHFGPCAQSKVAWHVDQFGHSREHSSIFAQMGFDAIVLGRIDYQDIAARTQSKTRELVWQSSPDNLGDKGSLFTHISGGYYAPKGYVMDGWKEDRLDNMDLQTFLDEIEKQRNSFKTNHVMIPMGSDFGFRNAGEWFENLDKLIDRINARQQQGSKINLLYSTPSCYINSVNKARVTWTNKTDDFFPYAVDNGYWTGYFTSKAGLKLHVKKAGALLQACKQLSVFAGLSDVFRRMHVLKAAMGVLQHHDAITGTEKHHVAQDYNKMLSEGVHQCQTVIDESYQFLTSDQPDHSIHQHFCPEMNITMCPVTESSHRLALFIYNPISRSITSLIRLPVTHARYVITGPDGEVPVQMTPISESTFNIPYRKSDAKLEAVFKAELPAMGMSSFVLQGVPGDTDLVTTTSPQLPMVIENKHLKVTIDHDGLISHIKNLDLDLELQLKQEYGYYESRVAPRASGAYIFAPRSDDVKPIVTEQPVVVKIFKGSESVEVHQRFNEYVSQVVRLYDDADYLVLEWTVGPIPVEIDHVGKEVVSLFKTDLQTNGEFYTDSNGRETLKRKRDYRETWKLEVNDRVAGNYYPVTSKMFIQDTDRDIQVTLLTDRCQGGGSIHDGEMELMVHRRTLFDDGLGVGEPLNERGKNRQGLVYRGTHYLYVGTKTSSAKFSREKAQEIHFKPTLSFVPLDSDKSNKWGTTETMAWSGIRTSLPANVHVLSLDYVEDNNTDVLLLRLEHFYEKGEHPELSRPATVDLENLFGALQIVGIEELSLGANFMASKVKRLRWRTESGLTPEEIGATVKLQWDSPLQVTLNPMEIRTFHIEVDDQNKHSKSFFKNIFR